MSAGLACPGVKLMLIEAAVVELEDTLTGISGALGAGKVSLQRIKNLLSELHEWETANEWENSYD